MGAASVRFDASITTEVAWFARVRQDQRLVAI